MINSYRIFYSILLFGCEIVAHTSPNAEKEMGTQPGDNPIEGGQADGFFRRIVLFVTLMGYYCYSSIVTYGETPLNYVDCFLIAFALGGFVLRMWCYYTLGNHFTFNLGIRKDHKLIQSGPYRYLVHPSYTGQIMSILGTILFFNGFYLALSCLFYIHVKVQKRIKAEEEGMQNKFGQQYIDYLASRCRFIPFVY